MCINPSKGVESRLTILCIGSGKDETAACCIIVQEYCKRFLSPCLFVLLFVSKVTIYVTLVLQVQLGNGIAMFKTYVVFYI